MRSSSVPNGGVQVGRVSTLIGAMVAVTLFATGCSSGSSSSADTDGLRVVALSTRPEYVSGGDVLVAVTAPGGGSIDGTTVEVEGRDVTAAFHRDGDRLVGLVDGLAQGQSTVVARAGTRTGQLAVMNHPVSGPVFSGPHQTPFVCTTAESGLGPPTDADCSAPTRTTTETVGDGVKTTVEKGVINRSIYTIAFPESGWNGRLVYQFGGGCGTSYSQGRPLGVTGIDPDLLARGYAIATSTLNTFQTACNDVLSAETTMMVKEHFIERFGEPRFTIGQGGSGGAIQQILIAQNYPGLLDAISPSLPFPDAISIAAGVSDCGLLDNYYKTPAGSQLTEAQRVAINGHLTTATCDLWSTTFLVDIIPTEGCDSGVAKDQIYDATTNPTGVRCTLTDANVNLFGHDPATGFAYRPLGNAGVQYGLKALQEGVITPAQFVELNERIGGYDIDGVIKPERARAPEVAFRDAYAKGRVASGGGLSEVPIIVTNVYTDPQGDIHDRQRAFAIRERLARNGAPDPNMSIWTVNGAGGDLISSLTGSAGNLNDSVITLDRWLTAAADDPSDATWPDKLTRAKPAEAGDRCQVPDGTVLSGPEVYNADNECTRAYPVKGDPRTAAGAPLRNDILQCRTKPIAPSDYGVAMPPELVDRLRQVFTDGVCDWTQPGVGQVSLERTWISFGS